MAISRKIAAVSLVLLTCVVYLPSLRCGFIWDDNAHVTRPGLRSLDGLYRIWFEFGSTQQYYPLLHSTFWLEEKLWGEQAWGYHLIKVLEHAAAAWLVYCILLKLQVPGAYFAATIFAVHPVQVESVAWISEQKNTLSAIFYLGALLIYLQFDEIRKPKFYGLSLILFVMALLTKTVTATLPAALLVIFWWQRGQLSWRRDVLPLLPWFMLGISAGLFTVWVEHTIIGATGNGHELTLIQRGLLASRVTWFYIGKLVWPFDLVFVYPRWTIDPSIWWQSLFPIAAVVVLIGLWLLRRHSRGPLACWLYFVGTLFPAQGFFNVFPFIYSYVADHFQYLACLGIIVLFAASATLLLNRASQFVQRIGFAVCAVIVATLSALSWQQIAVYADNQTLFTHTLQSNPDSWMAHNNLGYELMSAGKLDEAFKHFQESLRLNPRNSAMLTNLGQEAEYRGKIPEAIHWYQTAIENQPNYFLAHYHLGHVLLMSGHPEEAKQALSEAVRLRPDYAEARLDLGTALAELGETEPAIEQYTAVIKLQPKNVSAQHNLGLMLSGAGRNEEAVEHYQAALQFQPNFPEAQFNWANAISGSHPQDAIEHYQAAIKLRPDYTDAYANLATVYAQLGDRPQALASICKAVELAKAQQNDALLPQLEKLQQSYESP